LSATHIFGMDSVSMENKLMLEKLVSKEKTNWFYHPRNFEGIKEQITEIAKLVNKEKVANNIIKNMNKRLYNIQKSIDKIDVNERPSILVEIYFPPFTTAGINTFITDIIIKAGAKPALELKEDWPTISMEDIISAEPDIILRTHLTGKNKNLELLTAYKKNRVFTPSNIDIFLQPGVESIDAIQELYEYLYEASLIQTNNN
ncbi:MAG: ABC transporter substrate-binding protein, partial [Spirochaetes bacterium]|nr:ABC transporter substrate-binding protein [Spirochaetota bacterium]